MNKRYSWDTTCNTIEKTITHTFACDVIVFVDQKTSEVSEFKDGVLKNKRSDPDYTTDDHYARLLQIASDVQKLQSFN